MSIVCCATPSELYLEETRSTLAFAARAKLVKTNAKVNEVLDDRSLIRRLQRELAEARRDAGKSMNQAHLQALQEKASSAGTAAKEAEEKLRRVQASLINNAVWLNGKEITHDRRDRKKRRFSDGQTFLSQTTPHKQINEGQRIPKSMSPGGKKMRLREPTPEMPDVNESSFLRLALTSKANVAMSIEEKYNALHEQVERLAQENASLRDENATAADQSALLQRKLKEKDEYLETSIASYRADIEKSNQEKEAMSGTISRLKDSANDLRAKLDVSDASLKQQETLVVEKQKLLEAATNETENLREENATCNREKELIKNQYEGLKSEMEDLRSKYEETFSNLEQATDQLSTSQSEAQFLKQEKVNMESAMTFLRVENAELETRAETLSAEILDLEAKLGVAVSDAQISRRAAENLTASLEDTVSKLKRMETVQQSALEERATLSSQIEDLTRKYSKASNDLALAVEQVGHLQAECVSLTSEMKTVEASTEDLRGIKDQLQRDVIASQEKLTLANQKLDDTLSRCEDLSRQIQERERITDGEKDELRAERDNSFLETEKLRQEIETLTASLQTANDTITTQKHEREKMDELLEYRDVKLKDNEANLVIVEEKTRLLEEKLSLIGNELEKEQELKRSFVDELKLCKESLAVSRAAEETLLNKIAGLACDLEKSHTEQNQLREEKERYTSDINVLTVNLSELSGKLEVCEDEVSHLTRSSEGRDQSVCSRILGSETETSEGRLDELGEPKNISGIMSQVARITGFIIEARGVIANEREEQEHVRHQLKDCNMKIATLEKSIADAKNEACSQAQKAAAAQELYYKTKEELQHHQEKSESDALEAISCRDALRSELDQNAAAYNDLQSRFSLLEVENENLKVDNKSLSTERDRVLTDHAKAHEQISSYEEKMQKMSTEHDALEVKKSEFMEKVDRLSTENDSLHVELAEARTQLKRQEDDHTLVVQHNMDSIKELESQLQETKEELQHHQEKSESDALEAISCRDALRSELDQNAAEYNDLQSRFSLLEVENENLKVDNKSLSTERDRVLTDHAKAHEQISSYEEKMQKMSTEHDALEVKKSEFMEKVDRLSTENDSLHVELAEARTQLKRQEDDHTLVVQHNMDSIKELESQLQETKEELQHHQEKSESDALEAISCRDALRSELDQNAAEYNDLQSRFSLLEVENENLKVDNKSLSTERDRVLTDHAKAHEQISSYEEKMQKMSTEHDALEVKKSEFMEKVDRLSTENDSLHVELAEARTQLKRQEDDHTLVVQHNMDSIKELESQLQETKEELQHHQEKSESDALEAISCRDALRSELDQNAAAYNDLQSRLSLLEVENENLKVDNKSLSTERDRVLTDHAKAHEQISSYEEKTQKMSREHDALEVKKSEFMEKVDRLSTENDSLHVELAEARTQLKRQEDDHTLVVQHNMDSIKELESQLQETKEELQHHQEKSESDALEAISCRDALRSELDQNAAAYNDLQSRLSLLEVENENLKVDNKSLSTERDRVLTDHAKAHEQISSYEEKMQKMSTEHDALEVKKSEFMEKVDRLSTENDSLHVELAEARTQLKRQEDDHTLVVQHNMDSIKELESQLQETKEECAHYRDEHEAVVLSLDKESTLKNQVLEENKELKETATKCEQDLETKHVEAKALMEKMLTLEEAKSKLEGNVAKLTNEIESVNGKLNASEDECKERADELISLHDLLELSRKDSANAKQLLEISENEGKVREQELGAAISALQTERLALQQELQDTNEQARSHLENYERARRELLESKSGFELQLESLSTENKSLQTALRSTQLRLDAAEESVQKMVKELEETSSALQKARNDNHDSQSSDSIREIERCEKDCAEWKEKAREAAEKLAETKVNYDEERQALFKEADKEIRETKEALRRAESDNYRTRELMSDLREEKDNALKSLRDLEMKIVDVQTEKTKLERTSRRTEKENQALIETLSCDLRRLRNQNDEVHRRQAVSDRTLREMESTLLENKKEIATRDEDIRRMQAMLSRLDGRHLESANRKLTMDLNRCTKELAEMKAQAATAKHLSKELDEKKADADKTSSQIENLLQTIASKDDRIQKLEKVKLTKEKMESFKKTKKENEELKSKLEASERRIAKLNRETVLPSGQENDSEMASIRFANTALETKVRKYAAHCQRLEGEKADIRRALESVKIESVDDHDLARSVVILGDRITSLEQQLTAASKSEATLQTHAELERRLDQALESEAKARHSLVSLEKQYEDREAEKDEKIHYLERENLKLLVEMKETKKTNRNLKTENTTLRNANVYQSESRYESNVYQSESRYESAQKAFKPTSRSHMEENKRTSSPSAFTKLSSDHSRRSNFSDKETKVNASPMVKATRENPESRYESAQKAFKPTSRSHMEENKRTSSPSAFTKLSSDLSRRSNFSDKENKVNASPMVKASTENPSHIKRSTRKDRRVPGLGEAFAPNEENTQECKQS